MIDALTRFDGHDHFGFGQHSEHVLSSFGTNGIDTSDIQFEHFTSVRQPGQTFVFFLLKRRFGVLGSFRPLGYLGIRSPSLELGGIAFGYLRLNQKA